MCKLRRMMFFASASYSRSEEHTSELQSQSNLVCRLLLEKKKTRHLNFQVDVGGVTHGRQERLHGLPGVFHLALSGARAFYIEPRHQCLAPPAVIRHPHK